MQTPFILKLPRMFRTPKLLYEYYLWWVKTEENSGWAYSSTTPYCCNSRIKYTADSDETHRAVGTDCS